MSRDPRKDRVRRVVAWEPAAVGDWRSSDEQSRLKAYELTALILIHRAAERAGERRWAVLRYFSHGQGRWVPGGTHERVQRLADWLRHRDEEAGHR